MAEALVKSKPSFLASTWEGIKGSVKGGLAGAVIGAIGGAVVGSIIALATGGTAALVGGLIAGMKAGAAIVSSLGITAGAVTGVVQSREEGQVSAQDIVTVAKMSFAQGVAMAPEVHKEQTKFRDMVAQQRAQAPAEKNR